MTSAHFFFIPFIFFFGFFVGAALSTMSHGNKAAKRGVGLTPKTKGPLLASAFVVFAISFMITHMIPFPGGARSLHATLGHRPLLDQHTSSTAGEVYERLESFGEAGRAAYQHFTYSGDVAFPLSLLFLLIVLAHFVRERTTLPGALPLILLSIPVFWFLSDMIENSGIYFLLSTYPEKHILLANHLGSVTNLKFALLLGSIAFPAVSYALFRNRSQETAL